jgi:hypothetical protein
MANAKTYLILYKQDNSRGRVVHAWVTILSSHQSPLWTMEGKNCLCRRERPTKHLTAGVWYTGSGYQKDPQQVIVIKLHTLLYISVRARLRSRKVREGEKKRQRLKRIEKPKDQISHGRRSFPINVSLQKNRSSWKGCFCNGTCMTWLWKHDIASKYMWGFWNGRLYTVAQMQG